MLKQNIKNRLVGVIAQAREFPSRKRDNTLLSEVLFGCMKFAIGFLLSRTIIFSEYAPFGVAFTAALGGIEGSVAAFLGAFIGYALLLGASGRSEICRGLCAVFFGWRCLQTIESDGIQSIYAVCSCIIVGINWICVYWRRWVTGKRVFALFFRDHFSGGEHMVL